jgi:hypothetical protein
MGNLRDQRLEAADIRALHLPSHLYPTDFRRGLPFVEPDPGVNYREGDALVVTAMNSASWEGFLKDGEYRTVWRVGPTWHLAHARDEEQVLAVRRFNDERLFGGECRDSLVFGVLLHRGTLGDTTPQGVYDYLMRGYRGSFLVVWKGDAWVGDSTITCGDSQQNCMAFTYSEGNVERLVSVWRGQGGDAGKAFWSSGVFCDRPRNPYVEVQIHRRLTPEDVEGCFRLVDGEVSPIAF